MHIFHVPTEKQYQNKWFTSSTQVVDLYSIHSFSTATGTFESICGSRCKVLVWVKLEGQLSVRLLQVVLAGVFGNPEDFIKVLAVLYPAATQRDG